MAVAIVSTISFVSRAANASYNCEGEEGEEEELEQVAGLSTDVPKKKPETKVAEEKQEKQPKIHTLEGHYGVLENLYTQDWVNYGVEKKRKDRGAIQALTDHEIAYASGRRLQKGKATKRESISETQRMTAVVAMSPVTKEAKAARVMTICQVGPNSHQSTKDQRRC